MTASPTAYKLTIKTDFPSTFSGVVEISLSLSAPTTSTTFNTASPLNLLGAVLVQGAKRIPVERTEENEADELVTLFLAGEAAEGEATLAVRFEGRLDDGALLGYYRIAAPSAEGETAPFYAVTQFQPTSARKAFPCFDQPAAKAPFSISLISPAGLTSISNGKEKSREKSDGTFPLSGVITSAFLGGEEGKLAEAAEKEKEAEGAQEWEIVSFEKTPKMSTYLATWAVGEFESISSTYTSPLTSLPVPLSIYASKSAAHLAKGQGQLALDTLEAVMPVYEKLFDIPYELGKLDVLVCDEFDAGAMEGYGLITGRTTALLHSPSLDGVAAMQRVVGTVSHEAAHMYFGNLVTLKWWDDLWLNEAFATLIGEIVAVSALHPSWNAHQNFLKTHRTAALSLDSLRHSHPVHMCCKHEKDVAQTFDHISYEKGSAVLKMLMSLIGEDKFLEGTAKYLKAHRYGSTTADDLWAAFSSACDIDVGELMASWIEEVGYPVVTVEEDGENLKLTQKRFLDAVPETDDSATLWTIPLCVKAVGDESHKWVMMKEKELTIKKPGELYLLNSEAVGFYRVAYSAEHLVKLADEASKTDSALSLSDRVSIVQDVVALSSTGHTSTSSTLSFLRRLAKTETSFLVWTEIALALRSVLGAWWEQPEEIQEAFRRFGREVFGPVVERVGFEPKEAEEIEERKLRALVLSAAAVAEVPSVLSWIRQSFPAFLTGSVSPTAADLSPVILHTMSHHGGLQEYSIAAQLFANPPTPGHQMAAVAGLTGTREVGLLMETAGMLTSGEVQPERLPQILAGLAANPLSRRMVWVLFQQAWPMLEMQYRGTMTLGGVAAGAFSGFSSEADADAVEAFFEGKDTTAFEQPLQQALDAVRSKARWLAREQQNVQQWLEEEGYLVTGETEKKANEGEGEGEGQRDSGFAQ